MVSMRTCLLTLLSFCAMALEAQIINTPFGKNRVQYHTFDWIEYSTPHFTTFFNQQDKVLGKFALLTAEGDFAEIEDAMEYRMSGKIDLIVYSDLTDLKMSNIGTTEVFGNTGGVTKILSNKIFVYFNGSHDDLHRQIREGIARVFINKMLFGDNLQEVVQNAVLMNLPSWFTEGIVAYVAEEWNTEQDNRLRDAILSEKYGSFDDFVKANERLAGQAFWHYISQIYGKSTVSNLLYLTRINRSVDSGFMYVTGTTYEQVSNAWRGYYQNRYEQEDKNAPSPVVDSVHGIELRTPTVHHPIQYTETKISTDGRYVAYASNDIGLVKVHLYDTKEKTTKTIFKTGFRNNVQAADYDYPLLTWSPNGKSLSIFYEFRDMIYLTKYDVTSKKLNKAERVVGVDRILNVSAEPDGKWYTVTAVISGFSGVYRYAVSSGFRKVTRDFYDYRDASYANLNGQPGILFASNRPNLSIWPSKYDSIQPLGTYDLFFFTLDTSEQKELIRITNTPFANERAPMAINDTSFIYLSDETGIASRYMGKIDTIFDHNEQVCLLKNGDKKIFHVDSLIRLDTSLIDTVFIQAVYKPTAFSHIVKTYNRNIQEQSVALKRDELAEFLIKDEDPFINIVKVPVDSTPSPLARATIYRLAKQDEMEIQRVKKEALEAKQSPRTQIIDSNGNWGSFPLEVTKTVETPPIDTVPPPTKTATEPKSDTGKIDIDNYFFQSDFDEVSTPNLDRTHKPQENNAAQIIRSSDGSITLSAPKVEVFPTSRYPKVKYRLLRNLPYIPRFRAENITTSFDNSLLFGGLQSYAFSLGGFNFQQMGIMLKTRVLDVMEDYRFEAGIRIPTRFNGMEYFLTFETLRKRLDQKYSFYRKGETEVLSDADYVTLLNKPNVGFGHVLSRLFPAAGLVWPLVPSSPLPNQFRYRKITHILQADYKYPLDVYRSFRASFTLRGDKVVPLSTDDKTLKMPTYNEQRLGARFEYVFDNTIQHALNVLHGSRYKFYTEAYNRFNVDFTGKDSVTFKPFSGQTVALGVDARHYVPLGDKSVLALRAAGATSFGSEKILYILGGVENWLGGSTNTSIPVPTSGNYAYQALAANLRGFDNNIRNGNSFALVNAELRSSIFQYLSPTPLRSNFLRNFQAVLFFDAGTAWSGLSPYSDKNPLNTLELPENLGPNDTSPIRVTVRYFRNPIVMGYGFGFRTTVLGYFLKFDYAWGVETGVVQKPRGYFSIGTDF